MLELRYSAIDTAHRCLYKYKRIYLDAAEIPGTETGDTHFGTGMHAGIESCLSGGVGGDTFKAYWDSIRDTELTYSRFNWEQLGAMGPGLLNRFERLHKKHFIPKALELEMRGSIGPHAFRGTADYIGLYKGVPSIIDFKTSNRTYEKEKIITNEQLPIYAELAKQALGYKVEQIVYYVFVKSENKIQTLCLPVTEQYLTKRLENVILICNELVGRTVFPKNPNSCMMGSFKCPLFNECHGDSDAT